MLTGERGSVLLLFPTAFLVILILGAITVDVGLTQVRARELRSVAESTANDALAALDVAVLRDRGEIVLEPHRVRELVRATVAAGPLPEAEVMATDARRDALGRLEIAVTLRLRVELAFAPALPGGPAATTITRTGVAVILEG